jgi:hypothetical protein
LLDIGHLSDRGSACRRALLISPAGQFGEPFLLKDKGYGSRREGLAGLVQGAADVVNGEVLFAQGDDLGAKLGSFGRSVRPFGRGQEEGTDGIFPELVDQGPDTGGGIAEEAGDLGSRLFLDAVGAEGFVLALGSVAGLEEVSCEG